MDLVAPGEFEHDVPGENLLVRDARSDDHRPVADLLTRAGCAALESDPWPDAANTLVLYDPADGVVRGAVVVVELGVGAFELVAWAVEDVADRDVATARLIRAAADRLRRSGGERLVVSLQSASVAVEVLIDEGFGVLPSGPDDAATHVSLYQEL